MVAVVTSVQPYAMSLDMYFPISRTGLFMVCLGC